MNMFYKIISAIFIIFILVFSASAKDKVVSNKCGNTIIKIVAIPYPDSPSGIAYEKVTLTAISKNEKLELVFDESKPYRRGEYFRVTCTEGKNKRKYIVFQNYCGGSGCNSVGNYGIIDSENLKVVLMPDDMNKDKAIKILGSEPPDAFNLLDY